MGLFPSSTWTDTKTPLLLAPACGLCRLEKSCKTPKVRPIGLGKKRILIVSESPAPPGSESDRVLADSLRKVGIDLYDDCVLTYSLICDTEDTPTDKQLEYCRPNLTKLIESMDPVAIITLGSPALKSLLTPIWKDDVGYAVERWAGFKIPCQNPNVWILPTYHPAWVVRDSSDHRERSHPLARHFFDKHIAQVASCGQKKPWNRPPAYPSTVRAILNDVDAATCIRTWINTSNPTAIDIETNMLKCDSAQARIVCCSLSDGGTTIAYPWTECTRAATLEVLNSDTLLIASNMAFEQKWFLKEFGVQGKNWYRDTMLRAHWEDCRQGISGLKFQAFVKLGQLPYNEHIEPYFQSEGPNLPNRIHKVPLRDLLVYCGMDSLLEGLLCE